MKNKVVIGVVLAVAAIAVGCLEVQKASRAQEGGLIYRHHFAGTTRIEKGTNATKLKEVLELNSSKALGTNLAVKLARTSAHIWGKPLATNSMDGVDLLTPLIEDLASAESYVEVQGPLSRPEWVFAVNAPADRAAAWDKNLKSLAKSWKLGTPSDKSFDRFKGWEAKRKESLNLLQVAHAGNWTIVGIGNGELKLLARLLQDAAKNGRPVPELKHDDLLSLEADTPRVATALPVLAPFKFPPVDLVVSGRGENIRTEGKIHYTSGGFAWKPEAWKIPTNILSDPIISFTVARGIRPILKNIPAINDLGLKTLPNQFCAWGLGYIQGATYVTLPVDNATNAIQTMAATLPRAVIKALDSPMGEFVWASNRAEIIWQQIPHVVPHVRPLREQGQDYIYFAMFPMAPTNTPPPPELFTQLGTRNNLAYYDWEITGQRLVHGRQFHQLRDLFTRRRLPSEKAPAQIWLQDLQSLLGNTITEITVESDKELQLVRKSYIGFTGFELATLGLWFDSPSFPFRIDPQPKIVIPRTNAVPARASTNAVLRQK